MIDSQIMTKEIATRSVHLIPDLSVFFFSHWKMARGGGREREVRLGEESGAFTRKRNIWILIMVISHVRRCAGSGNRRDVFRSFKTRLTVEGFVILAKRSTTTWPFGIEKED